MLPYSTEILSYNVRRYPFARLCETFLRQSLTELHDETIARLQPGHERTPFHEQLYAIGEPFLAMYRSFVKELLDVEAPAYLYQAVPSFRVHLPGNVATGNFHRDSDFGHQAETINILVPLTPMADTASVWIESEPGANDPAPVTMNVGQYLRFHAAMLLHGSHPNTTGKSRVSFDFRVLPKVAYRDNGSRSAITEMPIRLGDYYADGGLL
jgi:hypothetical protein